MSDVSKIFAVEDWKKIYQAFSQIDLSSYDFDNLRRVLLDYVKTNFPEDFNDFIESSEFVALIDMMAYLGQSIAYRVDLNSRENFIDTATRRDSVIRMARLVGYTPKRNIPASGMLKLNSISTTQDLTDSNGNSLRNIPVSWNDPTNPDFQEHFNIILGQAMSTNQRVGKPARRAVINGVTTELYEINSLNSNPVLPFSQKIGGVNMNFEMVGAYIDSDGTLTERVPIPNSGFSLLYRNDGKGNGSPNTGWFVMFKQGTMGSADFGIADALPNQVLSINADGINNTDTWLFELSADGNFVALWRNISEISGNNIIYNSLSRNIRKVYSTVGRENDKVDLVFADGTFGDIPKGNFRYYYRTSNGLAYQIRTADMNRVLNNINVRTKNGQVATLNMNFALRTNVSNSSPAESFTDIKVRAPQAYYTQNRMITAEDYNIYPVITNQNVLKAKAVNRTSSGTNRYLDVVDPTGRYSSIKLFADDGVIYRKNYTETFTFAWSTLENEINSVIQNIIRPYLVDEELVNFYYVNFDRISFTSSGLSWNALHNANSVYDGYLVDSYGTPKAFGPLAGAYPSNVAAKGTLLKFTAPDGYYFTSSRALQLSTNQVTACSVTNASTTVTTTSSLANVLVGMNVSGTGIPAGTTVTAITAGVTNSITLSQAATATNASTTLRFVQPSYVWVKIMDLIGDGSNSGDGVLSDGSGPIVFNDVVPTSAVLSYAMPAMSRDLGTLESTILTAIQDQLDFGLGYDRLTSQWYYIESRDLSTNVDFSLSNAQSTTKTNADASWLMKFEYRNEQYKGTVRLLQTVFHSVEQNKFYFDSSQLIKDPLTGKVVSDTISVLKTNSDWNNGDRAYSTDIKFHIIDNIQDVDGYANPQEVRLGFADENNDMVPDDPDSFDRLVNSTPPSASKQYGFTSDDFVVVFERYTDSSGFYRWRLRATSDIVVVNSLVNIGVVDSNSDPYVDGQLIYVRDTEKLYVWKETDATYYSTNLYKSYYGRESLQFKYDHNAADSRRIDPALSNLIDIYVMTKTYNNDLRNWLKFDRNDLTKPSAPTSQELRDLLSSIETVKGMSDDIIYHPVDFKILFGSKALPGLRAKFKIVRNASSLVSDNEIKSRIASAIDLFFANANYDFGDTFYFTELAAFVHLQLTGLISSMVIVPESTDSEFGDLFQITSMPDEILIHDVTVDDIVIIDSVTPATITN